MRGLINEKQINFFLNRTNYFIIFGFIFLPLVLHLNKFNSGQYLWFGVFGLFAMQLICSVIIFILSYAIYHFFKNKISLSNFLICNFSIFYFLFYFSNIKENRFLEKSQHIHYLFDELLTLFFFIIIYAFTFYFLKKFKKETKKFFLFFLILNFIYGIYNTEILKSLVSDIENSDNLKIPMILSKSDMSKISDKSNVFLIILDGMMNLEKAQNTNVIDSSINFHRKLKENNYKYNDSFKSNYSATHVSIKSLLYGDYVVTEKSKLSLKRNHYFPHIMQQNNNFFYQIINKLNMNFFWIGNEWGFCNKSYLQECYYQFDNDFNLYSKILIGSKNFYRNHVLNYLFAKLTINSNFISAYNFIKPPKKYEKKLSLNSKKNNFYLIHVMKPHDPYDLDENCDKIPEKKGNFDIKKYYSYNYKCIFNAVVDWDKDNLSKSDNNIVIILGDHGWSFKNEADEKNLYIKDILNDVFFAYKVPEKCNSIKPPNSHVNVMRFVLSCLGVTSSIYLKDEQYFIETEPNKYYSKAIKQ
jgi:hypothetical protein